MRALAQIKKVVGKRVRRMARLWTQRYGIWKYSKYPPGHIFHITVDDMRFRMTFRDYKLDYPIVERIEGVREPVTTGIIKALVHPGARVLELGGCYGYFTAIMALCAGESGRVVSVEGTPNNFRILSENMALNGFKNVQIYNAFISAEARQVHFYDHETHPYNAIRRIQSHEGPTEGMTGVKAIKVTEFLRDINFIPDYVFMDIEGFERDVFADFAATRYLEKHRPVIVFEIHPAYYPSDQGLHFLLEQFKRFAYDCRRNQTNMICLPREGSRETLGPVLNEAREIVIV
jgi:FkbM family methyltransferase